jgi:UDPglucose 6-dehydrogenase
MAQAGSPLGREYPRLWGTEFLEVSIAGAVAVDDTAASSTPRSNVGKDAAKIARAEGDSPISTAWWLPISARSGSISPPTSQVPVGEAEDVFIAVGTPSRRGDGHPDLSYVHMGRARDRSGGFGLHRRHQIGRAGQVGVEIERIMAETRPDADVTVVSNPEFLGEGAAVPGDIV